MFYCPRCYGIAVALTIACATILWPRASVIYRMTQALVCTQCFFASDLNNQGVLAELPRFQLREVYPLPTAAILSGRES